MLDPSLCFTNVPKLNTSHMEKHEVNAQKMRRVAIILSVLAVGLIAAGGAVLGPQLAGHLGNMNWVYAGPGIGVAVLGLGIAAFAINQAVKASRPHKDLNAKPTIEHIIATINEDVGSAVAQKKWRKVMFELHKFNHRLLTEKDADVLVNWLENASLIETVEFLQLLPKNGTITKCIIAKSYKWLIKMQNEPQVIVRLSRHPQIMATVLLSKPQKEFSDEDFELMDAVFDAITPDNIENGNYQEISGRVKIFLSTWDVEKGDSNATLKGLVEGLERAHETRKNRGCRVLSDSRKMPLIIQTALNESTKSDALKKALGRDTL